MMTGISWLLRSGSDAWPIISSDRIKQADADQDAAGLAPVAPLGGHEHHRAGDQAERHQQVRSKVSSLTTSAEPISAPRTANWPAMPQTMPAPAKEPTSSVTAVELCKAMARPCRPAPP